MATTGAGHVIVAAYLRHGPVRGGTYQGVLAKYDGATGSSVWVHDFNDDVSVLNHLEVVGETAYLTGRLRYYTRSWPDPFNTGTYVNTGTYGEYDAFIASLDVGGASGFVANWVVQVGPGRGRSVTVVGEHLYVAGDLFGPSTIGGVCNMTGEFGGYLAKLSRATGACIWARDTPPAVRAVSDGSHVWTSHNSRGDPMAFDATHTVSIIGSWDAFIGKYQASDGIGLWAAAIGGIGTDTANDAAMTPTGPVFWAPQTPRPSPWDASPSTTCSTSGRRPGAAWTKRARAIAGS